MEPRNRSSRGNRRCLSSGRQYSGAKRHHTRVPPGSESRACMHWGSPGTWETLSSPPRIAEWRSRRSPPGLVWRRLVGHRSEQSSAQRYPRVKATKPEETGDRESERSIVPTSRGNLPQGTLKREGSAIAWNFWRERWREYQVPKPSQRNCRR